MGTGIKILKKEMRWTLLALLVYILVPLIVNLPYLISGNVMAGGDSFSWMNSRSLFAYGFHSGDPVLWNPFGMLGAPFMADIQNAFFYPLNYLSLIFPENVFAIVFYICTLALAGFFMYLFMTEMIKSRLVAFLTGLIFMFSTILGGARVVHQTVYSTIIWLPLVLYFIQRYIRTNNRIELLFSSAAMAMQFFAGFPQVAVYSDIFVFLYLIIFIKKDKSGIKKRIVDVLLWGVFFTLLIAIQLLPLAELIKDTGRNTISYEYFASYSADYKVLPMIFYPELFSDYYSPFGAYHTTGVDIEIYLGIIPAVFMAFAAGRYLKDKKFLVFCIFDILALLYCMIGNIPILGEIVWKIPILGSFRVASRMLFIYIFFSIVLFGMTIEKLKDRDEAKRLFKFSLCSAAVLLLVMIVVKALAATEMASEKMREYFSGIGVFSPSVFITLGLALILAVYSYVRFIYQRKHVFAAFTILLCIISIADVSRYSLKHDQIDYYASTKSPDFSEMDYIQDQINSDGYRSIAVIATAEQLYDSAKLKEFKSNAPMLHRFQAYNAYLTFESERTRRFTGLDNALIMPNMNTIVHSNHQQLSAASVKYITDPYHNISVDEQVTIGLDEKYLSLRDATIKSNNGAINAQSYEVQIDANQQYYIEFEAKTDNNPQLFYIDFYGEDYDFEACSLTIGLEPGTKTYSGFISTGDFKVPDDACLRIVSQSNSDIDVKHLRMYKVLSIPFETVYKTVIDDENTTIYENMDARPIVNVADNVADIAEFNSFKVKDTSYIAEPKEDVGNDAQVEILEFKNSSVKAKVMANEEVFVNHTQVMYPGWNAYVDGHKVQNYLVNQAYQGAYVPMGEHIIEFKFEPLSLYIGAAITLAGIVLLILLAIRAKAHAKGEPNKDLSADE